MTLKENPFVIIGGGLAGLTMACCLAKSGFSCVVIEKSSLESLMNPANDGRNTALNQASVNFFKSLGVWADILPFAQPIHDILVSDGTVRTGASSWFLHFASSFIGDQPMGYFVQNHDIRRVLITHIQEKYASLIDFKTEQTIQKLTCNDAIYTVHTQNHAYTSPIMMAIDGKFSLLRTLADIPIMQKSYGQHGIVLSVHHEKPHDGMAQEYFLPAGPFAMLPLTGNRTSLVWTETSQFADSLKKMPQDVVLYEIRRRFGDSLGKIWLDPNEKILTYPLGVHYAHQMYKHNLVLVADSAHGIHPISGQGFNLGLRDIAILHELICEQTGNGLDNSQLILEAYQQKRIFDITALRLITDNLNRIFSNDSKILQAGRRAGLQAVNHLPIVRDFFIQHATGMKGDIPKMMQPIVN